MEILIDRADKVKIGDIAIFSNHNEDYPRGICLIGKVLAITNPHELITEFYVKVLASELEEKTDKIGMKHERKVGIIRKNENNDDRKNN